MPVRFFAAIVLTAALCGFTAAPAFADWHDNRDHDGWHDGRDASYDHGRDGQWDHGYDRGRDYSRNAYYYAPPPPIPAYAPPRREVFYEPVYTTRYYPLRQQYIGDQLVVYRAVPDRVLYQLQPCPRGYYYSMEDNNVFLVRQHDNVIADILSLLVR